MVSISDINEIINLVAVVTNSKDSIKSLMKYKTKQRKVVDSIF